MIVQLLLASFAVTQTGSPRSMTAEEAFQTPVYKAQETIPGSQPQVTILRNDNVNVRAVGVPAYQIVINVASVYDHLVIWRDMPREPLNVNIQDHALSSVLSMVLNAAGYRYDLNAAEKTVTVYRQDRVWEQQPPAPPSRPAQTYRDFWMQPTPEGMTQHQADEWYRLRGMRPDYNPCTYGDYGCDYGYPYRGRMPVPYGNGNYGGYGYGAYYPAKGCMTGPSGKIKFKYVGRTDERVLWEVSVNGDIVGSIDQGDSVWNDTSVCAGSVVVKVEKRGAGSLERRYSVRPWELTEITVGDFLFPAK